MGSNKDSIKVEQIKDKNEDKSSDTKEYDKRDNSTVKNTRKPATSELLSPMSNRKTIESYYSSKVLDEAFLAKQAHTIVIGTVKQVLPINWNVPTGQVKELGLDSQGYSKGRVWIDENGNEKKEGELGVYGAIPIQDYLIQVEQVLKDIDPPRNVANSDAEFAQMTKWRPHTKPVSTLIRVRIANPQQFSTFEQGNRLLLMLNKTDIASSMVGPDHYTVEPPWYSFKLTEDGFAVRDNVPSEKEKLPLTELLDTINKAVTS